MTGQEPEPNPTETPPEPTEPTTEPQQTFDADYVKKLRAEAAQHRKAAKEAQALLSDLQKAQDAAEAKKLEEQGEWQKRAEQEAAKRQELEAKLEAQLRQLTDERRNRLAVHVATQLGAIDPTDANFLAAVSGVDVEADDAEQAIRQALEALRESRPYLFQVRRGATLASFNPAQGPQQPHRETDDERRERLYSGGSRKFFDPEAAAKAGGGLVWPKGKPEDQ